MVGLATSFIGIKLKQIIGHFIKHFLCLLV